MRFEILIKWNVVNVTYTLKTNPSLKDINYYRNSSILYIMNNYVTINQTCVKLKAPSRPYYRQSLFF